MAKKQIGIGSIGIQKVFDGVSSYVFIRYSSYANGQDMTDKPDESTAYIGMYTTTTGKASTDPKDYQWLAYKGSDGQDGSSPISAFLTDELITIATDHAGNGGNFDKTSTSIVIFEGTQEDTDNWTIKAEVSDGIIGSISGDTYKLTSLTKDTGQIVFTATKGANTITKIANVAKIKAGKPGEDGDDGANAKLLYLTSTAETVIIKPDGLVKENQNLYLTAHLQNMNGSVNWDITPYIGEAAQDKLEIAPTENSITITDKDWQGDWDRVVVITTLGGLTDTTTILSLRESKDGVDGVNAISTLLTNESITLPSNSGGTVSSFAGAKGEFKIYDGLTLVSSGVVFSKVSDTGLTSSISDKGAYSITAMSADFGEAVYKAVYKSAEIIKTVSVAKSKAGANGANGKPGSNGQNAVNYYLTLSSQILSLPRGASAFTPGNIIISAYSQTGGAAPVAYTGRLVVEETASNGSTVSKNNSDVATFTYKPTNINIKSATAKLYLKGATTNLVDQMSIAVVRDGANGSNGSNGSNGASSYTWVRYSTAANGNPMVTAPTTTTKYVGFAVTTTNSVPTYDKFTWSKYQGDDGLPAYVHNAWANSPDGTVDFTTVYPGENLLTSNPNHEKTDKNDGGKPRIRVSYVEDMVERVKDKYIFLSIDYAVKNAQKLPDGTIRVAYEISFDTTDPAKPVNYYLVDQKFTVGQTISGRAENKIKISDNITRVRVSNVHIQCNGDYIQVTNAKLEIVEENTEHSTPYTPSPQDDPIGAYPKYMGTCSNHSETAPTDPSEYHWEVDPTYLKYVTDGKVDQGNFDEGLENIYDVLGSKTDAEDFKNLQEQAKALQDSYESFTSDGGQYEKDLANLESRAVGLYKNLGDKLLELNFINTWFKIGEEGLVIGSDNSSVKMLLSNNQLSFVDAGQRVAYFTSQSFYINRGVIALSFQVGAHKITKIDNDYTVFQWVG